MAKKKTTDVQPTKAQLFAQSFQSEADLRLALITLLERLPGHSKIRHTHGTTERGKDIAFYVEAAFGRKELCACVVKNDQIKGSAESDKGARNVYNQAEQCFDTPLTSTEGIEEAVAQVYVITPFACEDHAITSISGKLKTSARIRFIFGSELFDLFEEYYPEYLLYKSGLFASYVADLEAGISSDNAVANVLMRHGVGGSHEKARDIYVQPSLEVGFSQFSFNLLRPTAERLREPFTNDELTNFISTIRYVTRAMTFWSTDTADAHLLRKVTAFTKKLRTHWQHSYESHVRQNINKTASVLQKSGVHVRLTNNAEMSEEFASIMAESFRQLDQLKAAVTRANALTASRPQHLVAFIKHPDALEYSFISGLSSRTAGLIKKGSEVCEIQSTSRMVLESGADYVVVAPAGFGKSSFCNQNALQDLQLLKEQKSDIVPILVKLHSLAKKNLPDFQSAFLGSSDTRELWDGRHEKMRKFRFYLDGLDEIPNDIEQARLMQFALDLKQQSPESQILVTCRDHVAGEHLRRFIRLNLSEMNDEKCNEFIGRWLGDDGEKIALFHRQVAGVPSLKQLIRVPLLATLILSVFSNTGTIPESRIRIYDMFVSLMAGGWDIAKNVQRGSEFGPQPKLTVLQALAWKLQIGGRRDATQFEFSEAVKDQLPTMAAQSATLLRELLQDGLLVQIGASFAFSHLSFQEYLAAKDLLEPTGRKVTTAIGDFLRGQTWWKDVLTFYVALSSQPRAIEGFIRDNVRKIAGRTFDPQILVRARMLLEEVASAFPGSAPSFDFPELAGRQLTFEAALTRDRSVAIRIDETRH